MTNRILLLLAGFFLASCSGQPSRIEAPVADRIAHELIMHGDTRIDYYYWMNDRNNPEVIAYLEKENAYLQSRLAHTSRLQDQLFNEMRSRIAEEDASAPVFNNGYFYYVRYETGKEYPIYCRRAGDMDAPEEILLDVNKLAEPHPYYRVGDYSVSDDNRRLAFTADTVGRRQYTVLIRDLESGEITPTGIEHAGGSVVWAADNQTLFLTSIDPLTLRYDRILRFNTETGGEAVEVYYEEDDTYYYMNLWRSKDRRYIMVNSVATLSNEIRFIHADKPESAFLVFQPRQRDLIYAVFPFGEKFYVRTNDQAVNFRLMETPAGATNRSNWREVIAHRPDVLLENVEVFDEFLVLQERSRGLRQLRIIDQLDGAEHYLPFQEEAYTAGIGANAEMSSRLLRFNYTSLTTPMSQYDYDMRSREQVLVKQQQVGGGFDASLYETRRLYAPGRDGTEVPVTLVYRKGISLDGSNPLLLYGYGSYGASADPRFNSSAFSLIDRGFVYAIAHIRGGQDMGRQWYEDGKLLNKRNTFYDFIDIADFLIEQGYTASERLFASGGSAGGLLVGAVINMRPELFRGAIAAVPFVDVVTTMLDESIPLTTAEYDEWGNPNDPVYYAYMLSYSPYDNVGPGNYPNLYVTSGLHDSQVQYWEPTKWVARLRHYNTSDSMILLDTNLEAGHGGASGRFRRLREVARQYAFMLDLVN